MSLPLRRGPWWVGSGQLEVLWEESRTRWSPSEHQSLGKGSLSSEFCLPQDMFSLRSPSLVPMISSGWARIQVPPNSG